MSTTTAPKRTSKSSKPAPRVTYLPPQNPEMVKLGSAELIAHGEKGEKQAVEAGLEFLRRKRNAAIRKAQA